MKVLGRVSDLLDVSWGTVVVAYNPSASVLIKKLERLSKLNRNIVVVNNGNKVDLGQFNDLLLELHGNKGIAAAQNIGAERLIDTGAERIFFFDQDSEPPADFCSRMLHSWNQLKKDDERIAILSPSIVDKNFGTTQKTLMAVDGHIVSKSIPLNSGIVNDTLPISSGILVSAMVYNRIGGAKESMFIDWVDFELDLNVLQHGFSIYTDTDVQLPHAVGKKERRKFLGKVFYPSNHQVFREYYYTRNALATAEAFGGDIKGLRLFTVRVILTRLIYVLYEDDKIKRVEGMISGVIAAHRFSKKLGSR